MMDMARIKTSIAVDDNLWREWQIFVIGKTGKGRRGSSEIEEALREYMQNHKNKEKTK